tara:strand:- start:7981 stop:8670 length:690 start_codon:yes stop_codon:yes gene_type:complete
MISHTKKLLFIHVPKTGGKSLSRFLAPYCDADSLEYFSPFSDNSEGNLHSTLYEYMRAYGPSIMEKYSIFSIIRNPWDKALSLHLHQNNNVFNKEHFDRVVYDPSSLNLWSHSHFYFYAKEALSIDEESGVYQVHEKYPPVVTLGDHIYYKKMLHFPIMLRFENYAQEVGDFLDFHGVKHDKKELQKKTNTTSHKHYSHYYGQEEIEEIGRWCALDIQMMGYRFEKEKT